MTNQDYFLIFGAVVLAYSVYLALKPSKTQPKP